MVSQGCPTFMKLTAEKVAEIVTTAAKRQDVPDDGSPGLVLRVAGNGRWGTWCWRFGRGGRRVTFGRYPGLTLAQARTLASRERNLLGGGADPAALRREAKASATIAELAEQFRSDHVPTLGAKTQELYIRVLDKEVIPKLGKISAKSVDTPVIARWHQGMKGTPRKANSALSILSTMLGLAETWGHRAKHSNPCDEVPRFDDPLRQRYLTPEELALVAKNLPATPAGDAIRILILTGMRLGEVLAMRWEWISGPTITIPAKAHKTGKKKGAKTLPLNGAARAVLEGLQRNVNGRVFPISKSQLERCWWKVRAAAKCPDARIHDLRHTFVSYGVADGISLPIMGGTVGHSRAATTERYAHLSQSPLRDAVERVGALLDAAMKKKA